MNNIHQVIFNKSTQQFVVASELTKSVRKPKSITDSAQSGSVSSFIEYAADKLKIPHDIGREYRHLVINILSIKTAVMRGKISV